MSWSRTPWMTSWWTTRSLKALAKSQVHWTTMANMLAVTLANEARMGSSDSWVTGCGGALPCGLSRPPAPSSCSWTCQSCWGRCISTCPCRTPTVPGACWTLPAAAAASGLIRRLGAHWVLVKFQNEDWREKVVGLGSLSSLDEAGVAFWWPATPWTALVCRFNWLGAEELCSCTPPPSRARAWGWASPSSVWLTSVEVSSTGSMNLLGSTPSNGRLFMLSETMVTMSN